MLGNLLRESGVTERLNKTAQNELMNIVTIFLGTSVGATATAANFLNPQTLKILVLGVVAFGLGTAGGVLLAKLMNVFLKDKINPLIAPPVFPPFLWRLVYRRSSARKRIRATSCSCTAMSDVAGVIGSAVAAGVFLALFGV